MDAYLDCTHFIFSLSCHARDKAICQPSQTLLWFMLLAKRWAGKGLQSCYYPTFLSTKCIYFWTAEAVQVSSVCQYPVSHREPLLKHTECSSGLWLSVAVFSSAVIAVIQMKLLWSGSEAEPSRSASHAICLEVSTNQKVAIPFCIVSAFRCFAISGRVISSVFADS